MTKLNSVRQDSFIRNVLRFGLPVALQNLLTSSMEFVDSIMIGGIGGVALGAVGTAAQWFSLLNTACWGFQSAAIVFFSQYWGAKDKPGIARTAWLLFACVVSIMLSAGLLTFFCPGMIMRLYSNDSEILSLGSSYLRIASLSYVFTAISTGCSGVLRSTENATLPFAASTVSLLSNVLLNWLFIYGKLGLPQMGVSGAALATSISAFLNMTILLLSAKSSKSILHDIFQAVRWPEKSQRKEFFQKSTPIILNEGLYALAMLFINMVFGRQGGINLSALTIFRTIEGMIIAFYWGLCSALSVMVGNAVGGGEIEKSICYSRRFTVLNFITTAILVVFVYCFHTPIIGLFHAESQVAAISNQMLLVLLIFMPLRTTNYLLVGVYRSGGETKVGVYFELLSIWLISLPLTVVAGLIFHWSFPMILAMSYSEEVVKIGLELWYMLSNRWLKPVTTEGREGLEKFQKRTN